MKVVEVPVDKFKIVIYDGPKRSMGPNRCNAGYFAPYSEGKYNFTLPVGHTIGDYAATSSITKHYCNERGTIKDGKFRFDSGNWLYMNHLYGHAVSTLVVDSGVATINDLMHAPLECDYAVSGIPIIRNGEPVSYDSAVTRQGWLGSELRATWHVLIGLTKQKSNFIHVIGLRTYTSNLLKNSSVAKQLSGYHDVIKLDGGGSYYLNNNGKVSATSGDRRVFSVIDFSGSSNAYPIPIRTLKYGCRGEDVKWLQQNLVDSSYTLRVDGDFGAITKSCLLSYQRIHGLKPDALCGPATRAEIIGGG